MARARDSRTPSGAVVGHEPSPARDVLGRVHDPCCGSSGMFVQSAGFIGACADRLAADERRTYGAPRPTVRAGWRRGHEDGDDTAFSAITGG